MPKSCDVMPLYSNSRGQIWAVDLRILGGKTSLKIRILNLWSQKFNLTFGGKNPFSNSKPLMPKPSI